MMFKGIELCCPRCRGDLYETGDKQEAFCCRNCSVHYPVILGIPDLRIFPDPYIDTESDWAKGKRVAERFADSTFEQLLDFYYSITPVVPKQHAYQYKRGLRSGLIRSASALRLWEERRQETSSRAKGDLHNDTLLEIGCGTAPLLIAAAPFYRQLIGVDIAFRWLVLAQKRLQEAKVDIPLICACAEALPLANYTFDTIVTESTIEHLRNQSQALAECYRVMRPEGYFFVSMPNKYTLGPDPHTGIWAGGYLPQQWINERQKKLQANPLQRNLLSKHSLQTLLCEAGFDPPQIWLPDLPEGQRAYFGRGMQRLINLYHLAKRLPISRHLLFAVAPTFHAMTRKSQVVV